MKKLLNWLPVLGMLLIIVSCDELLDDDDGITIGDLSIDATEFIQANYSSYDIEDVDLEDICDDQEVYEVELEDGSGPDIELYFTLNGEFLFAAVEISENDLPEDVLEAIATEFPGYSIDDDDDDDIRRFEFEDGSLQFEVELKSDDDSDMEVIFEENGQVVCLETSDDDDDDDDNDDDGNDDDNNGNDDDNISPNDLPAGITAYISANYAGYAIEDVDTEDICDDEKVYEIELEDGPGPDIELYFTLEGQFLFAAKEISEDDLPDPVFDAIAVEFPGYTIEDDDIRRFELEDGSLQFEVTLEIDDEDDLEVVFASDGKIICQESSDSEEDD